MSTQTLRITDMPCDHCARTVETAIGLPGVKADVSYDEGIARVKLIGKVSTDNLKEDRCG